MKYKYDREKSVYSVIGDDGQVLGEWPHIEICRQHPEYGYFFAQDENGKVSLIDSKGKVINDKFKLDLSDQEPKIKFLGHNLFAVKYEENGEIVSYNICALIAQRDPRTQELVRDPKTEEVVRDIVHLTTVKDIISADDLNVLSWYSHKNETNNRFVIQRRDDDNWCVAKYVPPSDRSGFRLGIIETDYNEEYETKDTAKAVLKDFYDAREERRSEICYILKIDGIEDVVKACIDGKYDLSDLPDECFDGRYFDMLREGFKKNFESYLGQAKNHGVTKQEIEMYIKEAKVDSDYMRMRAEQVRVNVDNITAKAQKEVDDGMIF